MGGCTRRHAHEARRLVLEAEEAQDKLNVVQNAIFSANEGMDRFKLQMNWNQEELEQWALAAKQKEDDNLALQKYTRTDDVKIKELRCAKRDTSVSPSGWQKGRIVYMLLPGVRLDPRKQASRNKTALVETRFLYYRKSTHQVHNPHEF